MLDERIDFGERVGIEEDVEALTRTQLASAVLALHRGCARVVGIAVEAALSDFFKQKIDTALRAVLRRGLGRF